MVSGQFTSDLSRAVRVLAAERGTTVQALVGEALGGLLRKHGKHPVWGAVKREGRFCRQRIGYYTENDCVAGVDKRS